MSTGAKQNRGPRRHVVNPVALLFLLLSVSAPLSSKAQAGQDRPAEAESLIRTYGIKLNVDDMEKALAFYSGKLGFEIADRSGYPDYVVLQAKDTNKFILNRVKKLRQPSATDTQLSFTLQVNDLDQSSARMKALGVAFAETERRKEAVGDAISIQDPFGRPISLMQQTIVKVAPFKEPRIYNFGLLIPDMGVGRDFYSNKLGFVVRSERYLPLDLPLGHRDKTFGFMLHVRPGVRAIKSDYPNSAPFNTLVFETRSLQAGIAELQQNGVTILSRTPLKNARRNYVVFEDPFGNVSELLETPK